MMPTLVEIAGYDEEELIERNDLDGRSITSLFNDVKNKKNEYSKQIRYWHYPFNVIYNSPFDGLPLTPRSAIMEGDYRSEEHTSELQSLMRISYAVFCLKKKIKHYKNTKHL